jgi:RNA polymerase sigma-70 factor (ECF subfamily)
VLKYQHKIVNLVMRYVRDPDLALDITQEAFLKAYRALPRFRGDSAFYTWLYRIAVNTAKNHLAAVRRRPMDIELDMQDPEQYDLHAKLKETDTPEGVTMSQELHATVEKAIDALPEDLRTAIILRELDGMSYEEIAQTMDCPVGTVRSRIFRARDAIGKKIGNLLD